MSEKGLFFLFLVFNAIIEGVQQNGPVLVEEAFALHCGRNLVRERVEVVLRKVALHLVELKFKLRLVVFFAQLL